MNEMTFCQMLNSVLNDLGISQDNAAEKLGISPQYLSDLKLGRRLPSVAVVDRICKWLERGPLGIRQWHQAGARSHGWKVCDPPPLPQPPEGSGE